MRNVRLLALSLLLGMGNLSRPAAGQTAREVLAKYQARLQAAPLIGYTVQRIDTFGNGDSWNHRGRAVLQRRAGSKLLGAAFRVSQVDNAATYYYNGNVGFELDDKAKTFELAAAPYAPSVLGSPAGQMLVEELLAIDSTYQSVTYQPVPGGGGTLHLRYPDKPQADVLNQHTYLVLDAATGLPRTVRTTMVRSGRRWTTTKLLTDLRLNAPADAAYLQQPDFLTTYAAELPAPPPAPTPTLVAQPAPAFELRSFAQALVKLSSYRGKVVLLDFWETSCAPCIGSMPHVQRLQDEHLGKLVVLGILLDTDAADTERAKGILQRQHARYINLVGTAAIARTYRVDSFPRYYVIGKDGRVAATHAGGGNLEELAAAVKAALAE
ncbi:TlpA family protein disulfide reductase [Hymenobacter sp. RP-2-7]|uniref:TlpA family protein disulfide reductase n=1 Tax=Hymenobacter polaris TaxID=2682546 RepID=A0A7Y0ABS5_9BACT|nr:TlpA disulfide reductase family protein [Hymenobacter polaris]NML64481.1 TlpA family protein disulfide reductase [Hymenobacter polaris]